MLHAFWKVTDPMMAQIQMGMFMKNVSMLGGALLIAYFGAGPLSLDARQDRPRHKDDRPAVAQSLDVTET